MYMFRRLARDWLLCPNQLRRGQVALQAQFDGRQFTLCLSLDLALCNEQYNVYVAYTWPSQGEHPCASTGAIAISKQRADENMVIQLKGCNAEHSFEAVSLRLVMYFSSTVRQTAVDGAGGSSSVSKGVNSKIGRTGIGLVSSLVGFVEGFGTEVV